jgi:uncharacterized protein involved in exopolysaccharide biosynthesis
MTAIDRSTASRSPLTRTSVVTDPLSAVLRIIRRRWRLVGVVFLGAGVLAAAIRLVLPRQYEAEVVLATVTSSRNPNALGGLAATLTGLQATGGMTPTPDMIVALMTARGVLLDVGRSTGSLPGAQNLAQRLSRKTRLLADYEVEDKMRDHLTPIVDRKTGLVTVRIRSSDSAAARAAAKLLVRTSSDRFVQTTRAQASSQVRGMEARVDTAFNSLQEAERQLIAFRRSNRVVEEYSAVAAERDRLTRAITISERTYMQAVADRESALARVLEDTPSVVIVDDVPRELRPLSRQLVLITGFFGVLAAAAVVGVLVIREV